MKREMKGFGKIFGFTFMRQIRSRNYIMGTVIFALLCFLLPAGIMGALEYFGKEDTSDGGAKTELHARQVFLADQTEMAGNDFTILTQTGNEEFDRIVYTLCDSADEALQQASGQTDSLAVVIENTQNGICLNTLLPDNTTLTKEDASILNGFLTTGIKSVMLLHAGVDPAEAARLLTPVTVDAGTTGEHALSETEAALENAKTVLGFLLPYLNIMILYFLILLYGQSVASNVIMEKTSKLMDTFLVNVRPTAMIFGKVLAVTAASILQFVSVLASLLLGFAAGTVLVRRIHPDSDMLILLFLDSLEQFESMFTVSGVVLAVLLMISGFLLYCSLSAIGGAAAGKPEDLSSTNVLFTMILVISFLVTLYAGGIGGKGTGTFAVWLDYVPFTSILVTPSRMILGEVSLLSGAVSLAAVLLAAGICLLLAGKVYRMMALYKGNPPTPAKLMKMMKQK